MLAGENDVAFTLKENEKLIPFLNIMRSLLEDINKNFPNLDENVVIYSTEYSMDFLTSLKRIKIICKLTLDKYINEKT